jgi:5-formyltetrahydrofolate cyclo-ligase
MEGKINLRIYAKHLRESLPLTDISVKLVKLIKQNEVYKNSQNVMLYYPFGHEPDLRKLLEDDKNFYLPRVNVKDLEVCPFKIGDTMQRSKFGIYEPISESYDAKMLDLVIVPALMCDKQGYRLGYGGGYYDRLLSKIPKVKKIAVIPKELYVEILPNDVYDIKMDEIIYA